MCTYNSVSFLCSCNTNCGESNNCKIGDKRSVKKFIHGLASFLGLFWAFVIQTSKYRGYPGYP